MNVKSPNHSSFIGDHTEFSEENLKKSMGEKKVFLSFDQSVMVISWHDSEFGDKSVFGLSR